MSLVVLLVCVVLISHRFECMRQEGRQIIAITKSKVVEGRLRLAVCSFITPEIIYLFLSLSPSYSSRHCTFQPPFQIHFHAPSPPPLSFRQQNFRIIKAGCKCVSYACVILKLRLLKRRLIVGFVEMTTWFMGRSYRILTIW